MRHLSMIAITLLLNALPRVACAQANAAPPEKPNVKVLLAIVERAPTTQSTLHVIIENISEKPQAHFQEWNSWGYGNLTVEWTDAQGHTGTVAKVPGSWTRNGPGTIILQPGEALVREISFDPRLWQGWPAITNPTTLTVKVTYRATGEPKVGNFTGWTGTATAKAQTVTIWPAAAPASAPTPADGSPLGELRAPHHQIDNVVRHADTAVLVSSFTNGNISAAKSRYRPNGLESCDNPSEANSSRGLDLPSSPQRDWPAMSERGESNGAMGI